MNNILSSALERERAALEARRSEIEQDIACLEAEREAVLFKLGHVIALLRGTEDKGDKEDKQIPAQVTGEADRSRDPVELAYTILEEHGTEPIHYRELADLVKQRGGDLEGSDPAMTLVSRLVADDRFVRPFRRGWYALRVHYPNVRSVGLRKKKKVKHRSRG